MSDSPELLHETKAAELARGRFFEKIPALSCTLLFLAIAGGFLVWDFSEIIFAPQNRAEALEIIRPGMRLTKAERDLNQQHYTTLYIAQPGHPPALDVTTCRRLPLTLQAVRKLFPRWRAPERATDRLLAATHFKIVADQQGVVRADTDGEPLVLVE